MKLALAKQDQDRKRKEREKKRIEKIARWTRMRAEIEASMSNDPGPPLRQSRCCGGYAFEFSLCSNGVQCIKLQDLQSLAAFDPNNPDDTEENN